MKPTYFGVNKYLQIYQSHFQRIKKKKKKKKKKSRHLFASTSPWQPV